MKNLLSILSLAIIFTGCKNEKGENEEIATTQENMEVEAVTADISIDPITHGTAVINWGEAVIYLDPTGGAKAFEGKSDPDFVLITDIHGDHMDAKTLAALELGDTKILAPQAVKDQLPKELGDKISVINNDETQNFMEFSITAIPMYNLPEAADAFHPKGRGNGYILEKDGKRLYISGDTEDIPEMRSLKNIDMALVAMNLPYTMTVNQAADAVLAFEPKQVYPFHYRGGDGLSDVEKFKELVTEKNPNIEVVLLEWYPEMD
ncbi:MAG: MBL fold metallo-hydrolase [Bacteroidota bacterium]